MRYIPFVLCLLVSTSVQAQDFNVRLVHKLVEVTKSPVPTQIQIDVVSQEELQNSYRKEQFGMCMQNTQGNFAYCGNYVRQLRLFIYGHWIPEKDPLHLHIVLYEKAGPDVLVHEFLHWWLHNTTEPKGIMNNEPIVDGMMKSILSSPTLIDWLGGGSDEQTNQHFQLLMSQLPIAVFSGIRLP